MTTTSIRNDYKKTKLNEEKVIEEAAKKWLSENVIFITEKINRKSVDKLINSIQKFESTFGPHRGTLPSVASVIDRAEDDLQRIIMGKINDQRAGDVLEYLSFIYNVFSSFFSKDLPVLLRTKMFKAAKENPDIPMDRINDGRFDISTVRKALAHAVEPTPEEKNMLRGLMKRKYEINAKEVASDLVRLAFKDLEALTEIEKTPVVSTKDESEVLEGDLPKKI